MKRTTATDLDPTLLRSARGGDRAAFAEIVRRYEQVVYSFAFNVCRDRAKASETLQDTFVNVYRKLGQFDGKSKFSTWLYSIVTNNCLMKNRRRKLERSVVALEELPHDRGNGKEVSAGLEVSVPAETSSPLEHVMNTELRQALDRAIVKLPMDYRIVFILRDIEGRSAEEVSKILRLSVPAVKSRLRRARVFLREELGHYVTP